MQTKNRRSKVRSTSQLLGVYIPTYNRGEKLKVCLKSFIPQVAKHGIPIFVSDNASTDGTEPIVRNLMKRYANLHYRKNGTNLGYSRNFVSLLKEGSTEFLWFFGDDDRIEKGAIDQILKYLKSNYDFLQINSCTYDNTFTQKIGGKAIHADHDITYGTNDHNVALANVGQYSGFISSMITKRSFLIEELGKLDPKAVPNLIYLHTILYYRSIINKKGRLIAKPLFSVRTSEGAYREKPLELLVRSYPENISYLDGYYNKEVLRKIKMPYSMLPVIFMSKRDHPELAALNRRYLLGSDSVSGTDKLLGLMILLLPNFLISEVAEPVKKVYNTLFR